MWFKLNDNFFDEPKIKILKSSEYYYETIGVFFELVAMASQQKDQGYVYLDHDNKYTNEMFACLFNLSTDRIKEIFQLLEEVNLISTNDEKGLLIINFENYQDLKSTTLKPKKMTNAEKQKAYRERKKLKVKNDTYTLSVVTDKDNSVTFGVVNQVTNDSKSVTEDREGLSLDNQRVEEDCYQCYFKKEDKEEDKEEDKDKNTHILESGKKEACVCVEVHPDFKKVVKNFEEIYGGLLPSYIPNQLNDFLNSGLEMELIIKALEIANLGKKSAGYAMGILKNWNKNNIFTMDDFKKMEGIENVKARANPTARSNAVVGGNESQKSALSKTIAYYESIVGGSLDTVQDVETEY